MSRRRKPPKFPPKRSVAELLDTGQPQPPGPLLIVVEGEEEGPRPAHARPPAHVLPEDEERDMRPGRPRRVPFDEALELAGRMSDDELVGVVGNTAQARGVSNLEHAAKLELCRRFLADRPTLFDPPPQSS